MNKKVRRDRGYAHGRENIWFCEPGSSHLVFNPWLHSRLADLAEAYRRCLSCVELCVCPNSKSCNVGMISDDFAMFHRSRSSRGASSRAWRPSPSSGRSAASPLAARRK